MLSSALLPQPAVSYNLKFGGWCLLFFLHPWLIAEIRFYGRRWQNFALRTLEQQQWSISNILPPNLLSSSSPSSSAAGPEFQDERRSIQRFNCFINQRHPLLGALVPLTLPSHSETPPPLQCTQGNWSSSAGVGVSLPLKLWIVVAIEIQILFNFVSSAGGRRERKVQSFHKSLSLLLCCGINGPAKPPT